MRRAVLAWGIVALAVLAGPAFAADTVYYYYTDTLHSAVAVTDAQGTVVERTYYAPYGQVLNRDLRDGPGYTGHEEDPETNLVYMQQRYYDPEAGRFLSTDPVQADGDGGSFNRYEYAEDNPYRYTDPDGRMTWEWSGSAQESLCQQNRLACGNALATDGRHTNNKSTNTQETKGHWWDRLTQAAGIAFARVGRLGGLKHRAVVRRVSLRLEDEGFAVTQEKYIPTPLGSKGYRFVDVYGKNDVTGEVRMVQVGRANRNGTPVAREVRALNDIQEATGIRPDFVDYNAPPVPSDTMPVAPTWRVLPEEVPIEPEIPIEP